MGISDEDHYKFIYGIPTSDEDIPFPEESENEEEFHSAESVDSSDSEITFICRMMTNSYFQDPKQQLNQIMDRISEIEIKLAKMMPNEGQWKRAKIELVNLKAQNENLKSLFLNEVNTRDQYSLPENHIFMD